MLGGCGIPCTLKSAEYEREHGRPCPFVAPLETTVDVISLAQRSHSELYRTYPQAAEDHWLDATGTLTFGQRRRLVELMFTYLAEESRVRAERNARKGPASQGGQH